MTDPDSQAAAPPAPSFPVKDESSGTRPPIPDEIAKQAREHAWNWFALHAAQRMQAFNFFMVATAFLIAAYASVLEKHPVVAAVVAGVGAWLAFLFNRLDARSRQLVEAGEKALQPSQAHLASLAANSNLKILDAVEQPAPKSDGGFVRREWFKLKRSISSYEGVINWVQRSVIGLFLIGAVYAICLAIGPGSVPIPAAPIQSSQGDVYPVAPTRPSQRSTIPAAPIDLE